MRKLSNERQREKRRKRSLHCSLSSSSSITRHLSSSTSADEKSLAERRFFSGNSQSLEEKKKKNNKHCIRRISTGSTACLAPPRTSLMDPSEQQNGMSWRCLLVSRQAFDRTRRSVHFLFLFIIIVVVGECVDLSSVTQWREANGWQTSSEGEREI